MISSAIVKIRAFVSMALVVFSMVSFAQEDKVLNIDAATDKFYLMPYVTEYSLDTLESGHPIFDMINERESKGEFKGAYQKIYKISLSAAEPMHDYLFTSKLGNYATDLYLFYENSNKEIVEQKYKYNELQDERKEWVREAVLPLPPINGTLDIFVLGDYNSWKINEWYLYSNDGYVNHKDVLTRQAIVYLVLVFVFLVLSLVGYFILKQRIIAYYAFYLFATSLYIFKELNTLPLHIFYDYPTVLNFLNESVVGIFLLSTLFYIKNICDKELSYSFEPLFFKLLLTLTVISIFIPSFIMTSPWSLVFSSIVNYGIYLYFIVQLIPNFKKSIPLKFFFLGIMIIVVLGFLMELQLYHIINFPDVFYWTIPALILELLLVGIGIIYSLKIRSKELQEVKISNSNLAKSVINLEKKISHSKGAYHTLMAKGNNGDLNLPPEYLKQPLTQREIEVVHLLDKGYNNQELADSLFISRNTVKTHLKNIYKKLEVSDRESAIEKMKSYGVI